MDAKELEEVEAYFRKHDLNVSEYNLEACLLACIGLVLVDMAKSLKPAEPKKKD